MDGGDSEPGRQENLTTAMGVECVSPPVRRGGADDDETVRR
jgi:hypothetical protein